MHRALGRDWGQVWFDHCDRGRFKVGVPPTPVRELRSELAAARRALTRARVLGQTDFVAVRSTARELSRYQDALDDRFEPLLAKGMFSSGLNPMLNAVTVTAWNGMGAGDRRALEQEARDAPVNVVIQWSNARPIAHH
jgi:hypothetical protein